MGDDQQTSVRPATLPTRDSVTRAQLDALHSVMQNLHPYIMGSAFRDYHDHPKIDGGVVLSATLTFVNVCSRIDELLADAGRWTTEPHDRLYASIEKVQKAQTDYLEAQAAEAWSHLRPSVQFRPTIANDGTQFVAYYGDITRPGYSIVGMGATPEAALESFDRAFKQSPQEQIILAADSTASPQKPKNNKKKPLES